MENSRVCKNKSQILEYPLEFQLYLLYPLEFSIDILYTGGYGFIFLEKPNVFLYFCTGLKNLEIHFCFLFLRQEGWRLEHSDLENSSSDIVFKGVVFNEMKGALVSSRMLFRIENFLCYTFISLSLYALFFKEFSF